MLQPSGGVPTCCRVKYLMFLSDTLPLNIHKVGSVGFLRCFIEKRLHFWSETMDSPPTTLSFLWTFMAFDQIARRAEESSKSSSTCWKLRKSQCKISEKIRGCQQFLLWSLVNLEAFTYFCGSVGAAPTQALACFSRQHGEIPPRCDIEFHPLSGTFRTVPWNSSEPKPGSSTFHKKNNPSNRDCLQKVVASSTGLDQSR